ncbi:hypothetical protein CS8_078840 [Cupriavidus sp. 8B]
MQYRFYSPGHWHGAKEHEYMQRSHALGYYAKQGGDYVASQGNHLVASTPPSQGPAAATS